MVTRKDIGHLVQNGHGHTGVLTDVIPDYEDSATMPGDRRKQHMAFVRPKGGGVEWLALSKDISRLQP
ncbi:hypothetical protein [Streptomyces sp. WAC01280]|uniref:hypothetical protein n=1 Tax=Streptomyces sp. WAC01280 TaxID=2487424 RepID=UPI000F77E0E6|nr:hypothetical protein [Streptomyces sp. WAC01280]RSS50546.1 hypothetical protein EF909_37780 [Streptomyces sp. WAC01280]